MIELELSLQTKSGLEKTVKTMILQIERFSFECRKTKTKVITLANHNEHRQYSEPIKTRSHYM